MERPFLLILVGLTSVGAYLFGAKRLGLSRSHIGIAAGKTLEGLGVMFVFLMVNLAVGVIAILVARGLRWGSLSLYVITDETLLMLSVLQGLMFHWWREASTRS